VELLLTQAPPKAPLDRRRHRRRNDRRPKCTRKFVPQVAPGTGPFERSPHEPIVLDLLSGLGISFARDVIAMRILLQSARRGRRHAGSQNGQQGWAKLGLSADGVFLKFAENGTDLNVIKFVEDRYGFVVILITDELLAEFQHDPKLLREMIENAKTLQGILRVSRAVGELKKAVADSRRRQAKRQSQRACKQTKRPPNRREHTAGDGKPPPRGGGGRKPSAMATASQRVYVITSSPFTGVKVLGA
jgi:hypothetical protein